MQWILNDGFHTGSCTVNSLTFILRSNIKPHSLLLALYVAFVTLSTPSPYPAVMELWGPILCPLIVESFVSQGCAHIVHTVSSAASALTMTRFVVRETGIFLSTNAESKSLLVNLLLKIEKTITIQASSNLCTGFFF